MMTRFPLSVAAVLSALVLTSTGLRAQDELKIFLLLGQSNMEGQAYTYDNASTDGWNIPTMEFLLSGTPAATSYLSNLPFGFVSSLNASWLDPRDDVWCVQHDSTTGAVRNVLATRNAVDIYNGVGPLSPGFGVNTNFGSMIGPELAMGIRLGDATAEPIFLFKSNKGGTTLGTDWRPPTAVAARGGTVGPDFARSMTSFRAFLDGLDADLGDDGMLNAYGNATSYKVAGVFWFQGWNEQFNDPPYTAEQMQAEYADNLRDLIYSIRAADPRIPGDLGLLVGESSDQNAALNAGRIAAVDALNGEIPNSAAFFDTAGTKGVDYGNNNSGAPFSQNWGYHFHARAENFLEIGWKAAGAALDNGFLGEGALLYLGTPQVDAVTADSATLRAAINDDADMVKVVWDTADRGTVDLGNWANVLDLPAWTGGSGDVPASLGGLFENTSYVVRYYAASTALAADAWSPPVQLTTPFENPPPVLGGEAVTGTATESADVECRLSQAGAEVTLVWAEEDQGAGSIGDWTGASGGGSHLFGEVPVDSTVMQTIGGLAAGTAYAARFVASNPHGTVWSGPLAFNTRHAPGSGGGNLVAYWSFDEYNETGDNPPGTPQGNHEGWFEDLSGNGHTAYAADMTNGDYVPMGTGRFGNGFYSKTPASDSNQGARAVVKHTDLINFDGEDFTISFWEMVKYRDVRGSGWGDGRGRTLWFIKAPYVTDATVEGYGLILTQNRFEILSNNSDNFGQTSLGARYTYPSGSEAHDSGQWAHWAITGEYELAGDQYAVTVHLNGVAVDWDGAIGTSFMVPKDVIDNSGDLTIGGFFRNNSVSHQRAISWNMKNSAEGHSDGEGWMDDFAIWAELLSVDQIAALADGSANPLTVFGGSPRIELTGVGVLPGDIVELAWKSVAGTDYEVLWSADGEVFTVWDTVTAAADSTIAMIPAGSVPVGSVPTLLFKVQAP